MRVICAGFGRTGTSSLKAALETLLDAPCYHFEELFKHAEDREAWARFVRGENEMDWVVLYDGYGAAVDFPSCAYYAEIAEAFPDALVILSTRDLESWARSWQSLWRFLPYFQSRILRRMFTWVDEIADVLQKVITERTFHGKMDPASMIETHECKRAGSPCARPWACPCPRSPFPTAMRAVGLS